MEKLKIEYVPIDELKPYENNAKIHTDEQVEQIKRSIEEFGFNDPIAVWKDDEIIEGHGRLIAAKELGMEQVPIIRLDELTDDQRRAYMLVHNKLTMNTDFDLELLEIELEDIEIDMSVFGFDESEIGDEEFIEVEEDEVPEPPEEPKSKLGDIYKLGDHILMCGDSTDHENVEILMRGGVETNEIALADMVFTDPPYQLDTQGGGILKTANSMKQIRQNGVDNFDPASLTMWSKTNIFCHNKPLIKAYIELAEENNMPYDLAFYKKKNTVPNYKGHLMTDVEYIAIIGNQDPNKGLDKDMYSKCFIGQKDSDNELSYSKPVGLCAKYIRLYSKETVLDLFGGSGSTLIACEQLNRKCYMMELDPKYVDVIIARWENFTGRKAEKIIDGFSERK